MGVGRGVGRLVGLWVGTNVGAPGITGVTGDDVGMLVGTTAAGVNENCGEIRTVDCPVAQPTHTSTVPEDGMVNTVFEETDDGRFPPHLEL